MAAPRHRFSRSLSERVPVARPIGERVHGAFADEEKERAEHIQRTRRHEPNPACQLDGLSTTDMRGTYLNDDIPVVAGEPLVTPTAVIATAVPEDELDISVATAHPAPYTVPSTSMSRTGTWTVPGCGSSGFSESKSSGDFSVQAGAAATSGSTTTGTWSFPGTGSMAYGEGFRTSWRSNEEEKKEVVEASTGLVLLGDGDYVDDRAPVMMACGQGKSIYDVKGSMSSYVLVEGDGLAGRSEKDFVDAAVHKPGAWALRSEDTGAGDGGIACSSAISDGSVDGGPAARTMLTGGKDCMLREWHVESGRPRLIAEITGHNDWVSCCALVPPVTSGAPPTAAVSGGRDGCVRIWSRSSAAAEAVYSRSPQLSRGDSASKGSRKTGGGGGGGGGGQWQSREMSSGWWSCAAVLETAHGTSEFVTCAGGPGAKARASGGWVATGGTDWTVRLWDVVKVVELGRLSFRGHNHPVRSLAVTADGAMLASGGEDQKVVIWSPKNRRAITTLQGHVSTVNGIAMDPGTQSGQTPRWVASGCAGGSLMVWDPRNWRSPVATLQGEVTEVVPSGAFSRAYSMETEGPKVSRTKGSLASWEGETAGASMLNSVNCLSAGAGGEWLVAAGETVLRAWHRSDGNWVGGVALPAGGLGGVASLTALD